MHPALYAQQCGQSAFAQHQSLPAFGDLARSPMNYSHRISRRGPKNTYAHSMGSVSEKISRTSARIAMVGRLDQCDAHQLEPFKLALVKTELKLCVGRRPALQGLTGIGIPSRKTQARHTGQLCSIRDKSGGGRSGGEPYRRLGKPPADRNRVELCELLRL